VFDHAEYLECFSLPTCYSDSVYSFTMPSDNLEVLLIVFVLHEICSKFDALSMTPALPDSFGES